MPATPAQVTAASDDAGYLATVNGVSIGCQLHVNWRSELGRYGQRQRRGVNQDFFQLDVAADVPADIGFARCEAWHKHTRSFRPSADM